jgi:hydrogenase expression/formation protein HypD
LKIAQANPDKAIVFFGIGFETTAPSTALTVLQAEKEGIKNFSLFCNHVRVVPAMEALLENPDLQLDGFVGPGHVSMVIGTEPYEIIAEKYHKPLVVAGFEPLDVLQALWMVLQQLAEGRCEIENQYTRLVQNSGNAPVSVINTYLNAINSFYEKQIQNLTGPRDHVFNQELVFDNNTLETATPTFFTYDDKPNNTYQCQESVTGNSVFKDCGPAAYVEFSRF